MGGGNSKSVDNTKKEKEEEKKDKEQESEEEEEENESLEKIKEEEGEEEEEEDDDNKNKSKKKKNDKNNETEKNSEKSNKVPKVTNSIIKKKKKKSDDNYFSVEDESSNKNSDINSINKNSDINTKLSNKSSFIDARKYNTSSSFTFSKNSKISDNNSDVKTNKSNALDPPKIMGHNEKRTDNQAFGEFNYNYNITERNFEEIEEKKSESAESEPYRELTLKEKIFNEYQRHKDYLDTNEKGVYAEINKKSYKNAKRYKYRKSVLLHEKEITCICSLSGKIKKIAYATSSLDKSIKFWNASFINIKKIKNLEWHSNFLCEFDTTNILSSESIYIKMYDLMSDDYDCIRTFRDHIDDINSILSLINFWEDKYIFISGGKDKILRLWDHEMDKPIKFFEGHYEDVTHIQKIGSNNKNIISCSNDKTFIVWDINNTSPVKIFNNYFNHLYLLGDNIGFCVGAYDNKIRFYDDDYLLKKCLVSELYGIRYLFMIDDYYMLTIDIDNNINVLDIYNNNFLFKYSGCVEEVVCVIKAFNWDLDNSENKIIITACKDGYAYLYSFELEINNKNVNKEKKSQKKEKEKDKEKGKTKNKKSKEKKHKKK